MADKLTLADFAPPVVTVNVKTAYGRALAVLLALPTSVEWMKDGFEVSDPPIPYTRIGDDNKPAPNPNDKDYLRKREEASELRGLCRLAGALTRAVAQQPNNPAALDVPGATLVEKARCIQTQFELGVSNALLRFLGSAVLGGKAEPYDSFRDVPAAGTSDVPGDGLDTGDVVESE